MHPSRAVQPHKIESHTLRVCRVLGAFFFEGRERQKTNPHSRQIASADGRKLSDICNLFGTHFNPTAILDEQIDRRSDRNRHSPHSSK